MLVDRAFIVYRYILLARILMTWLPNLDATHPVVQFLYQVTEPILAPVRKIMPRTGMIDFSPLVVFLLLDFVRRTVVLALWRAFIL